MDIIKDKYVREPSDISGKTRNVWAENTIEMKKLSAKFKV
jgi:hypothetical protein